MHPNEPKYTKERTTGQPFASVIANSTRVLVELTKNPCGRGKSSGEARTFRRSVHPHRHLLVASLRHLHVDELRDRDEQRLEHECERDRERLAKESDERAIPSANTGTLDWRPASGNAESGFMESSSIRPDQLRVPCSEATLLITSIMTMVS